MLYGLKNISATAFFLCAALCFEVLYCIMTPPLQAPDEFNHFYRAYQISEGNFLPLKKDRRLGGYVPKGIADFTDQYKQCDYIKNYTITYYDIRCSFDVELNEQQQTRQDFANTAYYSPVSYLPQAFILFVLRQCQATPAVMYYCGRLFVFLVWLFGMYYVLRVLPAFKWLFTLLALLPMNMHIVNSFSADTVTNLLSFLFIALVLKHIFVTERVTQRHLLLLCALLVLIALAKVVYIGLAVLLLAIPGHKFKSMYHRVAYLALLLLISGLPAALWSNVVMKLYIAHKDYDPVYLYGATLSPCGDYYAQKDYLLSHGMYFPEVIYNSLFINPYRYLSSYIGAFGHLDIVLPPWMHLVSYGVILGVALNESATATFTTRQKLILLSAAGLAFVLVLLSQHLIWDCVGSGMVDLLQGRYLIPLFPLIFITLGNPFVKTKFNSASLVIPFITVLNLYSSAAIYHRFFVEPPCETIEFTCNAEERTANNEFKTSDPAIALTGIETQTTRQHRSGSHSALLTPALPYCFTYRFKNLRKGDLVEIEAWQKGDGALLIVSGGQKNCGEVYFGGSFKSGRDRQGWLRIKTIYEYKLDCDSISLGTYAWNSGKTDVFVDDISVKITRFTPGAKLRP